MPRPPEEGRVRVSPAEEGTTRSRVSRVLGVHEVRGGGGGGSGNRGTRYWCLGGAGVCVWCVSRDRRTRPSDGSALDVSFLALRGEVRRTRRRREEVILSS